MSPLVAAKKACKEATKKVKSVKLAITMAGAKTLKLYGNLLSDEARQSWGKVMRALVT